MSFVDSATRTSKVLSSSCGCGNGISRNLYRSWTLNRCWSLNRYLVLAAVDERERRSADVERAVLAYDDRVTGRLAQKCFRLKRQFKIVDMIDTRHRFEQRIEIRETGKPAEVPTGAFVTAA